MPVVAVVCSPVTDKDSDNVLALLVVSSRKRQPVGGLVSLSTPNWLKIINIKFCQLPI